MSSLFPDWDMAAHILLNLNSVMYVNNIEPEMFLPPGSESFNHNATRTTSSRSRSNNVNNNIVPVYTLASSFFLSDVYSAFI